MATATEQAIQNSDEWLELTPKQRLWFAFFLAHGDALRATKAVYKTASERNARMMTYEIKRNPRVLAILGRLAGRTEREIWLDGLKDGVRRTKKGSVAYVRAQSLFAHAAGFIEGYSPKDDAEDEEDVRKKGKSKDDGRFKVGETFTYEGKRYKIVAEEIS